MRIQARIVYASFVALFFTSTLMYENENATSSSKEFQLLFRKCSALLR
jgi:hypothetical protein